MAEYTQLYSGLGWGTTFEMNAKKPLIAKRSFPTLNDAYGYVNDLTATGTACPGLIIAVTADTNDKNNGIYWIKSIGVAGADGELVPGELIKAGSGTGSMAVATLTVGEAGKVTEATADNIGQVIYVTTGTDAYPAGPYIVTGDGNVAKLGTTTATGDIAGDVETLKGKVGTLETTVGNAESGLVKDVADIKNDYVKKVEGQRLMTDAEGAKLAGIADGAQVNVIESVKVDGTALDITNKSVDIILPVTGIVTDDKILSLDGKNIKSSLVFTRETIDGADSLVVKGNNDVVIGKVPVADFVADGMLESVTEVPGTNKFKFTFKKVDGSTEDFEVDFGKFVDTYHADGTTLELDSTTNTFKVKDGVFAAADTLESAKDYTDTALKSYYTKTAADELLDTKANASALTDYIASNDDAVALKADAKDLNDYIASNDAAVALKADAKDLNDYIASNDAVVALKANASALESYYTKTEADALLGAKANASALDAYTTTAALDGKINELGYAKSSVLDNYVTNTSLTSTLEIYAKTQDLTNGLAAKLDITTFDSTIENYVLKTAVSNSTSVAFVDGVIEVNAITTDDLKQLGVVKA